MRLVLIIALVISAACAAPEAEPERTTDAAVVASAPSAGQDAAATAGPVAPSAEPVSAAAPGANATLSVDDGLPQPVRPFSTGLRGELLFQSDREGPTRLYILDLATAMVRRVGSLGNWADEEPAWSHDGRRIAFSSTRGEAGNFDIFVMDADGGNVMRLTDHRGPEQDPVWAADDQSLFFTGERDGRGEIYRVWLADKRVERVTSGFNRAIMPATSRDGRYLAYAAQMVMYFQLHLLDLTNGSSRQITTGAGSCRPSFAPDSQEIAFVRMDPEPSRLEAVREAGPRILLQDQKRWAYYPDYSPDGRWIAFSMSPEHHEGEDWDLALMDMQQPGQFVYLTTGRGNDRVPDWRPR